MAILQHQPTSVLTAFFQQPFGFDVLSLPQTDRRDANIPHCSPQGKHGVHRVTARGQHEHLSEKHGESMEKAWRKHGESMEMHGKTHQKTGEY
jgi:hypothetical protein